MPVSKKEKLVLWLMPDSDSREHFRTAIHKLSDKFLTPKFEPHITLGKVPDKPIDFIKKSMKKLVEKEPSFKASLSPIVCGKPPFQRFASEVTPAGKFLDLSDKIDHLFNGSYGKKDFFHISFLYGYTACDKLIEFVSEADMLSHNHLYVQKISLVKIFGRPEEWQIIHTESFQN